MGFFRQRIDAILYALVTVILLCGFCLSFPPANFPSGSIIIIPEGMSASLVAKELADAHIIASPALLEFLLRASGESKGIQAGAYRFQTPQNLFRIAYRIIVGVYDIPPVRITFPEGITVQVMATQVAEAFSAISETDFLKAGESYEGYLFPDTYLFSPAADAETIIKTMRTNFNTKIAAFSADIFASGHSLSDVVTMASLIEKEARTDADRHIIAGILWNRLAIGMPLQVDAARGTYSYVGFPPEPICNPGLESLEAALHPTKTKYFYYLTGKDGLMYYAMTFADHQDNLKKYLQ